MPSNAPLQFAPVTPAQFAHLAQQAQSSGIAISGNSGSAAKFGVEVSWNYAPDTQQLTLECLHAPFFVRSEDVEARLRELVQQSLASA
ncbi:MAG TPA: hypothetical protein VND90_05685 [Terracidiphilus sp.]|nr:hypothetical protein [Terracidiphilus sp.]